MDQYISRNTQICILFGQLYARLHCCLLVRVRLWAKCRYKIVTAHSSVLGCTERLSYDTLVAEMYVDSGKTARISHNCFLSSLCFVFHLYAGSLMSEILTVSIIAILRLWRAIHIDSIYLLWSKKWVIRRLFLVSWVCYLVRSGDNKSNFIPDKLSIQIDNLSSYTHTALVTEYVYALNWWGQILSTLVPKVLHLFSTPHQAFLYFS